MSVFFLDTSALVKRYFAEIGTGWIRAIADPAAGNLRLQSSSPAIDRGVAAGYATDADGVAVPQDGNGDGVSAPDIGAYEYRR